MKINETTKEFLKIVAENPDLPIVCSVDSDIVCDDCGRWIASFGHAEVGECAIYGERFYEEREGFKEAYYDDHDEELCERFGYNADIHEYSVKRGEYTKEQHEANSKAENQMEKYLDEVAEKHFIKAIIVNIDLPDFVL